MVNSEEFVDRQSQENWTAALRSNINDTDRSSDGIGGNRRACYSNAQQSISLAHALQRFLLNYMRGNEPKVCSFAIATDNRIGYISLLRSSEGFGPMVWISWEVD
jgi:hypothetical protein